MWLCVPIICEFDLLGAFHKKLDKWRLCYSLDSHLYVSQNLLLAKVVYFLLCSLWRIVWSFQTTPLHRVWLKGCLLANKLEIKWVAYMWRRGDSSLVAM